jgi:hypothetical protein
MNFYTRHRLVRLILKTLGLFLLINLLLISVDPLPALGKLSIYGWLVPARSRLPYGEQPTRAYNLSLNSLEAMFASHQIKQPKQPDEFRVILLGDSSVWGVLLHPDQTLDAYLNAAHLRRDGRPMRFYNLGYPVQSLTKDVLILDEALRYQPDLIIWLVTLEAFAPRQQFVPMLVRSNADRLRAIPVLTLTAADEARLLNPAWQDRTLIGRRRDLADLLWLQIYGLSWSATGIDQVYPSPFKPTVSDFEPEDFRNGLENWYGLQPPHTLTADDLAFNVLRVGMDRAASIPVLLINEPIFVSSGLNSDLRYNYFYPRWVYDQYRVLLRDLTSANSWSYRDLWDSIPPTEFTDSPVHLTPAGSQMLAAHIAPVAASD